MRLRQDERKHRKTKVRTNITYIAKCWLYAARCVLDVLGVLYILSLLIRVFN